jgi:hypothetical protein
MEEATLVSDHICITVEAEGIPRQRIYSEISPGMNYSKLNWD